MLRRASHALCLVLSVGLPRPASAEGEPPAAPARAAADVIAPFIDDDTIAVAHVDLSRTDVDKWFALATAFVPARAPLPQVKEFSRQYLEAVRRVGGRDLYLVVSLADVPESAGAGRDYGPFAVIPLARQPKEDALGPFQGERTVAEKIGDVLFIGRRGTRERLATATPRRRPELGRALQAVGESEVKLVVIPGSDRRRVVEELMPTLPAQLGGGPTTILTRGALWAALGADASPQPALRLVIQSQTADAARALRDYLTGALRERLTHLGELNEIFMPEVRDDRLAVTLDRPRIESLATVIRPAVERLTGSARWQQSTNQLKQIGLAMHVYADANKHFPPAAINDTEGRKLLSWRVAILPQLNQKALYDEFHLDEPWDSPHNRRLIDRIPDVYRSFGSTAADGRTSFVVPVGLGSVFEGKAGTTIGEIPDGTSHTIMATEIGDEQAVIWTKPDDYSYDPKQPAVGFTSPYPDGRLLLFCDGSVHFIKQALDDDMLRRLLMRNDGQPVPELR
jgi:hypothetical protein